MTPTGAEFVHIIAGLTMPRCSILRPSPTLLMVLMIVAAVGSARRCRDYLSRRHYSAVLYLSSSGSDFWGGDLRFRGGSPQVVVPRAGQLVRLPAHYRLMGRVADGGRFSALVRLGIPPASIGLPRETARDEGLIG